MELQESPKKAVYDVDANGNKLDKLVLLNKDKESNDLIKSHVEHDIGVMFMYQAMRGFFKSYQVNKPYLEYYNADINIFKTLYNEYNENGKGIKVDFALVNAKEYETLTGNMSNSAGTEEFLYFIVTPIDKNDQPINIHYSIFNLNHGFEIDKDIIDSELFSNLTTRFLTSNVYNEMLNYSNPIKPAECIYYSWTDINEMTIERNIHNRLYKEVHFIIGEIIEFTAISTYFRMNPSYIFKEDDYKAAYLQHEKRITIIGKYMPDDIIGKEGFFDMGDLRP